MLSYSTAEVGLYMGSSSVVRRQTLFILKGVYNMKVADGFWLNKKGYDVRYASQAYCCLAH